MMDHLALAWCHGDLHKDFLAIEVSEPFLHNFEERGLFEFNLPMCPHM